MEHSPLLKAGKILKFHFLKQYDSSVYSQCLSFCFGHLKIISNNDSTILKRKENHIFLPSTFSMMC